MIKHHVLAASVCALAACAIAQQPASPLEAVTAPKADAPATIAEKVHTADPEIVAIGKLLTGSFGSTAAGESPELRYNAAPIDVNGLDNAVYFEIGRGDSLGEVFRQGVLHLYRFRGELRLRVFDIGGNTGLKDTMVGLWAVPEVLPKLELDRLSPNLDLVLSKGQGDDNYTGQTAHPFPTTRDGAIEMTSKLVISRGQLSFLDSGTAADGSAAWGSSTPTVFKRFPGTPIGINRTDSGLIILTMIAAPSDNPKLIENGTIAVQYTGWLTDGTRFDTSRQPNRQAFSLRIPGNVIKGWNEGLMGMAKGERRRLVIPSELAYGKRGFQRVIPPDSMLIFDIECVHVDNTPPAEVAPATPSPANPAPIKPPTPTPPTQGKPVGQPQK